MEDMKCTMLTTEQGQDMNGDGSCLFCDMEDINSYSYLRLGV